MLFKDKYIAKSQNHESTPSTTLIELSDDAYAIGEMIEMLANRIEHARRSLLGRSP